MSRAGVLLALLLVTPQHARAFAISRTNGLPIRWATQQLTYWVNAAGSADISGTADLDAIRAGVRSWNDVPCSPVVITERGSSTAEPFLVTDTTDGRNVIAWIEDSRWSLGSRVLAVTTPVYNTATGEIVDADIAMNGYSVTWSTSSSRGMADVESVAVHELGHLLGLQHVLGGELLSDPPTMAPYMDPQLRTRTLTSDDEAGLCYLYPEGAYVCRSNDDCPFILETDDTGAELYSARIACNSSGACSGIVPQLPGSGDLGDYCGTDEDCASGTPCVEFAGQGYCAESCAASAGGACPSDFTCVPTSGDAGDCIPDAALGGANCPCDDSPDCEAACVCDLDCVCACDSTPACDEDCACDADCDGGCGAAPAHGGAGGVATLALLLSAFVIMFARAARRRRGGARSGQV